MGLDIHLGQNDHPPIPQKGDQIEAEKHQEEGNFQVGVVHKAREGKLGYCGEISIT